MVIRNRVPQIDARFADFGELGFEFKDRGRVDFGLRRRFAEESLFNRLWIVEASTAFEGLLTADERRGAIDQQALEGR